MKPAPTLMDEVYRASLRNKVVPGWNDNAKIRHAIERARRFVVDDSMASFMAELANVAFLNAHTAGTAVSPNIKSARAGNPLSHRIADSLRVQARLPYDAIWIEYPLRVYQRRANEIRGTVMPDPKEVPTREGWLIQQHPNIDTAYIMHIFTQSDVADEYGFDMWTFPFALGWCADDSPLPWWNSVDLSNQGWSPSSVLVGIRDYNRNNVNMVRSPLINDPRDPRYIDRYTSLLREWMGVVRRVWAFLAVINDTPKVIGEVRQSKGFLARGRIRKYLDHSTITLNVPARIDTKILARQLVAVAHRKRHPVRAHWRDDWRHMPAKGCDPHLWEPMDDQADRIECSVCHGRMSYIKKHERGDATLGWVSHSYNVTHEENGHGKKLDQKGDQEAGAIAPGPGSAGRGEDTLH